MVTQEAVVRSHGSGGHLATSPPRHLSLLLVPGHRLECLTAAWAGTSRPWEPATQGRSSCSLKGAASGHYHMLCHYIAHYNCVSFMENVYCILISMFCTNPSSNPPSPVRPCTSLPLLFHHLALIDFPQPGSLGWPSSSGAVAGIIKMLLMMVAKPNPSMGSLETSLRTVRTARRLRTSSEHHSSARLHLL